MTEPTHLVALEPYATLAANGHGPITVAVLPYFDYHGGTETVRPIRFGDRIAIVTDDTNNERTPANPDGSWYYTLDGFNMRTYHEHDTGWTRKIVSPTKNYGLAIWHEFRLHPGGFVVGTAVVEAVVPIVVPSLDPPRDHVVLDLLPFADWSPGRWAVFLTDAKPTTERCPECWGELPRIEYCSTCGGVWGDDESRPGTCEPYPVGEATT